MKAGGRRTSALDKLKSRPSVQQVKPSTYHPCNGFAALYSCIHLCALAAGSDRFSAATSHEQNDVYMEKFDKAYAELEAMSVSKE